jgi:hypothetical protein
MMTPQLLALQEVIATLRLIAQVLGLGQGASHEVVAPHTFTNFTWDDPVLEMTPLMPSLG